MDGDALFDCLAFAFTSQFLAVRLDHADSGQPTRKRDIEQQPRHDHCCDHVSPRFVVLHPSNEANEHGLNRFGVIVSRGNRALFHRLGIDRLPNAPYCHRSMSLGYSRNQIAGKPACSSAGQQAKSGEGRRKSASSEKASS